MKRLLFLLLLLPGLVLSAQAQSAQVDSLTAELEAATDTTRVRLLNELAQTLRRSDRDRAQGYAQQALALAEQVDDGWGRAWALETLGRIAYANQADEEALGYFVRAREAYEEHGSEERTGTVFTHLGDLYRRQENFVDAVRYYERAVAVHEAHGEARNQSVVLRRIGGVYRGQGNYVAALDYFQRSLQLREALGDQRSIALALTDIGAVHLNREGHDDAVSYFQRALASFETLDDKTNMAIVLGNLGAIFRRQEKLDEALATYDRALAIIEESGNQSTLAFILNNTATVYRLLERYDEALDYSQRARQIQEAQNETRSLAGTLENIGRIYGAQGRFAEARDYGLQSLDLAQQVGAKAFIQGASDVLHQSYAELGNYREAYRYQQLWAAYSDSLTNEEQARQIGRLESQYAFSKQREVDVQAQEETQRLVQERRTRNRALLVVGLGFLAAMLTAGAFHVRTLRRKNAVIEEQKHQAEALAQQAETANQAKNRFLANISHEFRTPLTLTFGPLDDALDGRYASLQEARPHFERARRNGGRLLRLINQLLDLSKLDAGALLLRSHRHDLARHLHQLTALFNSIAETRGIDYSTQIPDTLWHVYDSDKLEKVIVNLLSNAFKFTPAGRKIAVSLEAAAEGGVQIVVADTGSGIPEADLPHLFDRFYQVEGSSTRQHEGSGIGLALVKELVELHEGTVAVESTVGFGTRFTVWLPDRAADEAEKAEESGDVIVEAPEDEAAPWEAVPDEAERIAHTISASLRIVPTPKPDTAELPQDDTVVLIVEDNADMRQYIRAHLDTVFTIVEAENGRVGLERARETVPDLVLSDVMMPEMDGLDLCAALKEDPATSHIPVVLLTARTQMEHRIAGYESGADAYLPKPFSAEELIVRARTLIEAQRRLRARYAGTASFTPVKAPPEEVVNDWMIDDDGVEKPAVEEVEMEPVVAGSEPLVAEDEPVTKEEEPVQEGGDADEGQEALNPREVAFLHEVETLIKERLGDPQFGAETLAEALQLSRRQLYRKLRALVSEGPGVLIRQARLQEAARLLNTGEATVKEAMYAVGFSSHSSFNRAFRQIYGMAPTEYAEQARHA